MARLPWQHGRSRTKSGGEKNVFGGPQDWFSRTTSEPSRQALNELVKQHRRDLSDGSDSMSPKSRLRSNTANSQDRTVMSHSRSGSENTGNNDSWYSNSHDDVASFTTDKAENTAKAILSKGSLMLRRRGSKLSMSSNGSSSTLGFTSPSRTQSINNSNTRRSSKDDMKTKISAPFDFQHVTHTEQTQFHGLGRIDESELAQRFSTLAVGQKSAGELKGIDASEIPASGRVHNDSMNQPRYSTSEEVTLPSTPQRPAPPPKDDLQGQTVAAPENRPPVTLYSPLVLSPVLPSFAQDCLRPLTASAEEQDAATSIGANSPTLQKKASSDDNPLTSKPLPQIPVIHAVTTDDDSARAMIAVPLPSPPSNTSSFADAEAQVHGAIHHRQKSSIALPRHYTLYPSSKSSMPNLLSADRQSTSMNTLSRHHSDMALSRLAREPQTTLSTRTSMSFAAVDTGDWEAAVDEAWDVDDDQEFGQPIYQDNKPKRHSPLIGSLSAELNVSNASTPLMMMAQSQRPGNAQVERTSPSMGTDFHKLDVVQEDECSAPLSGLGISSFSSDNHAELSAGDSFTSNANLQRSQSTASSVRPHCLTRSSSSESVIHSLASSIVETQRSSKSSVFTHDFTNRKLEDLDEISGEDSLQTSEQSRIRPESGCLPSDILEQYQLIYGSSKQPPEFPESPTQARSGHKHQKSASKIPVPERRSSMMTNNNGQITRSRANTLGNRPRQNSRISYSLFPAAPSGASATIPI